MQRNPNDELLPHLFRHEYVKMTAVLCRHFGLKHIEIAEDIASDVFLKASENWAINGVPENPTAWLYAVARNKTKDYFKHLAIVQKQVEEAVIHDYMEAEPYFEFSDQNSSDSLLAMIFAVCNSGNSTESQICLALQILCGFSMEEIANAFLTKTETIKKRLQRGRVNLRNDRFQIKSLSKEEIKAGLDTVLRTLYLLFNEGYFSKTNNQLIRKELCSEAIRLTLTLTENPLTNSARTNALLSLMCFQSSRLDARMNEEGDVILFENQDKDLWDRALIDKGVYYLVNACNGDEISKYHLEAGIAYWHTTPTDQNKWKHILQLYNQLIQIEYSPITVTSRIFAFSKVYGRKKGIAEAEKFDFSDINYYHQLLGYLYSEVNIDRSVIHYERALELTRSKASKKILSKELDRLKKLKLANEQPGKVLT